MAERSRISLQVIPFDTGFHWSHAGSFVLLQFEKAEPVVQLETKNCVVLLDTPRDVAPFRLGADKLRGQALSPRRSIDFIMSMVAEYER